MYVGLILQLLIKGCFGCLEQFSFDCGEVIGVTLLRYMIGSKNPATFPSNQKLPQTKLVVDCKTVVFFANASDGKYSNERSGASVKTARENGERRLKIRRFLSFSRLARFTREDHAYGASTVLQSKLVGTRLSVLSISSI